MAAIKPENPRRGGAAPGLKTGPPLSIDHYLRLLWHRKWLVVGSTVVISAATFVLARTLPDIYTSDTLILVDPQKVPEAYVKSTVTGDIRNRLGTLSQQILSATRLQKIIDAFNLYAEERKALAREDVIAKMRGDIRTAVANDFGGGAQDLQAFRISYRARDPRVAAQVTNQLAALFIEENLKAREEQATGTTEFLSNQLQDTRKALEQQEQKLRDFKLKHLGEMPAQETANLQILGQLQSQLQLVNESLGRTEQQRSVTLSLMTQASPPVVELEDNPVKLPRESAPAGVESARGPQSPLEADRERLQALLSRYTESHPDVKKLRARIAQQEALSQKPAPPPGARTTAPAAAPEPKPSNAKSVPPASPHYNPVLKAQLEGFDTEIAKQREEQRRLTNAVAVYRSKVEAIPVREQQIAELQRDYEMSKAHYAQLLEKQLSAETATQLEIRQKGEKFTVLDPAVPADRPSSPNRRLINSIGVAAGVGVGLLLALCTELFGMAIIDAGDIVSASVLEVIPIIQTRADRKIRRRRLVVAAASVFVLAAAALVLYATGSIPIHL